MKKLLLISSYVLFCIQVFQLNAQCSFNATALGCTGYLTPTASQGVTSTYTWGDGSTTVSSAAFVSHLYANAGTYTVTRKISGYTICSKSLQVSNCSSCSLNAAFTENYSGSGITYTDVSSGPSHNNHWEIYVTPNQGTGQYYHYYNQGTVTFSPYPNGCITYVKLTVSTSSCSDQTSEAYNCS